MILHCNDLYNCKLARACSFSDGDVKGGSEDGLGYTNSEDECAILVKKKKPTATGATWQTSGMWKRYCYAEFGDRIGSKSGYRACLFKGTVL